MCDEEIERRRERLLTILEGKLAKLNEEMDKLSLNERDNDEFKPMHEDIVKYTRIHYKLKNYIMHPSPDLFKRKLENE